MSEVIADVLHVQGVLRIAREGAEVPIAIPANGVLTVTVMDGASITLDDSGAAAIVGIEYLDADGNPVEIEPSHTDAKFFRATPGAVITVRHNQTLDLLGAALPPTQRIATSSGKDFQLAATNTQAFFAYSIAATDFRWGFADPDNYVAVPGDWAGAPPDTQADATTRLAAAVAGLLGAPIP